MRMTNAAFITKKPMVAASTVTATNTPVEGKGFLKPLAPLNERDAKIIAHYMAQDMLRL